MKTSASLIQAAVPFLWAGLLLGISFLEAPLKFRAPGVTLALGVGIGKLVFNALNRVEWLLVLAWAGTVFFQPPGSRQTWLGVGLLLVLLLQTLWLLPALSAQAEALNPALAESGRFNGPSLAQNWPTSRLATPFNLGAYVHLLYVALELMKLVLLFTLGCVSFSRTLSYAAP